MISITNGSSSRTLKLKNNLLSSKYELCIERMRYFTQVYKKYPNDPEIIKRGGEVFDSFPEAIDKIKQVKENYSKYKTQIDIPKIDNIAAQYINFGKKIHSLKLQKKYNVKKIELFEYYRSIWQCYKIKLSIIRIFISEIIRIINQIKNKISRY